jgi:hypothetical protein
LGEPWQFGAENRWPPLGMKIRFLSFCDRKSGSPHGEMICTRARPAVSAALLYSAVKASMARR